MKRINTKSHKEPRHEALLYFPAAIGTSVVADEISPRTRDQDPGPRTRTRTQDQDQGPGTRTRNQDLGPGPGTRTRTRTRTQNQDAELKRVKRGDGGDGGDGTGSRPREQNGPSEGSSALRYVATQQRALCGSHFSVHRVRGLSRAGPSSGVLQSPESLFQTPLSAGQEVSEAHTLTRVQSSCALIGRGVLGDLRDFIDSTAS
ncbi:hypothetical protein EYF80_053409 [Liparis tanakae]|uniref:Uncharacterized protein n=1 Tax=Liparis tanakae TaxID=230148 RepID=A0A4Z2F5N4_9TELE|nr:hypothetical protein EYF80_053409 [Liparis tanakae]